MESYAKSLFHAGTPDPLTPRPEPNSTVKALWACLTLSYVAHGITTMNLSILCGTNPSVREEQQQDSEWDILGVRIDSTLKNLNLAPRSRQAVVFALTQRINSPIFARGLET